MCPTEQSFAGCGYHLPPTVWLMELTADYSEGGGKIKLRGWAYEHSDVAACWSGYIP